MPGSGDAAPSREWRPVHHAGRTLAVFFLVALIASVVVVLWTSLQLRSLPGVHRQVTAGPGWLPVLEGSRDGNVFTLRFGPGLAVLVLGTPAVAAGVTYLARRRSR